MSNTPEEEDDVDIENLKPWNPPKERFEAYLVREARFAEWNVLVELLGGDCWNLREKRVAFPIVVTQARLDDVRVVHSWWIRDRAIASLLESGKIKITSEN